MRKTSKTNRVSYLCALIAAFLLCLPLMLDIQANQHTPTANDVEILTVLLLVFQPCFGALFSWYSKWSRALWVIIALALMLFYVTGEQNGLASIPVTLLAINGFVLPLLLLVTIVNFSICFIRVRKHKTTL